MVEQKTIIKLLKEKLNQEVTLRLHSEFKKSMGSSEYEDHQIILLGIYGIEKRPIYIHGRSLKIGDRLYRTNNDIYMDSDSGHTSYSDYLTVTTIDDINVKNWFAKPISDKLKDALEKKMKAKEPKTSASWAEKIVKGISECRIPGHEIPLAIIDEPKFIDQVLTHLNKIV